MQYYYINGIFRKINFTSSKYSRKSACLLILGFVGALMLVLSISALDSYVVYNEKMQVITAVGFYVIMLLVFITLLSEMHKIKELTGC